MHALVLSSLPLTRDPSDYTPLILVVLIFVILFAALATLARYYRRCPANKILVIYGKTGSGAARCIHGGAAFVIPLFQAYDYLDLEPFVVPVDLTNALSMENIRVAVPTTVTAAISNESGVMENAAIRLLGLTRQQIQAQAQDIILGQMRAVIATMRIEEINSDRQAFMAKVNEAVSVELEKIGLALINVNIRDIEDESGYIQALGRKAAATAINQANVDVAEQERIGQIGVAERQKEKRIAVAAANAAAEIGEVSAARDKRQRVARLEAEAVETEADAEANKAAYRASQHVAEQQARGKAESAAKEADGAIRVSQELAQKKAEEAKAQRETARLNAEVVVPADAQRQQVIIAADAKKQEQIRLAEGEAQATLARMTGEGQGIQAKMTAEAEGIKARMVAEGEGTRAKMVAEGTGQQALLDGKAKGYQNLVSAAGSGEQAASLLLIEKLLEVAHVQAQAIRDLPLEKIIVWDGGGKDGGMANLGQKLMGALPPMHELARQVGLDLPEFLGKMAKAAEDSSPGKKKPEKA
ncbi:MAG: Inner membrane protein YqiK [Planctomycetes bacterium ADurb.Bin126]|nr:MAG: Inner membrane protein YqiK [Planctomycetes bacterium ADurb.Bin126]HQL72963.1 SPFH domain-containing protein [Phycisphaerae bacterium]